MRMFLAILLSMLLLCAHLTISAQEIKRDFFKPSPTLNKKKVYLVTGSIFTIYGSALLVLNQYWYKGFDRSRFHFFNDGKEWLGMDKTGHVFNAYYQSRWAVGMYRWTGLEDKKAIWVGGMTGTFLQSSIEILDGFSEKWGFSGYDFLANMAGSAIVIGQELAWKEQRIMIKISAIPQDYPEDLEYRAEYLFGNSALELFLKDYNAITTWASFNIASFIKRDTKFPKWLNVAVGYGANGMYGGFDNKWCSDPQKASYCECDEPNRIDRSDIERYPQFYLSLDVDLTKIESKSPIIKSLAQIFNMIKIPSPTLEFNPQDKVKFHPLFF